MSNSDLFHELQEILKNGQIPSRVTNRLLLAGLVQLFERQDETDKAVRALTDRVERAERYPSILRLFWTHPKSTISAVAIIFILLTLAYQAGTLPLF